MSARRLRGFRPVGRSIYLWRCAAEMTTKSRGEKVATPNSRWHEWRSRGSTPRNAERPFNAGDRDSTPLSGIFKCPVSIVGARVHVQMCVCAHDVGYVNGRSGIWGPSTCDRRARDRSDRDKSRMLRRRETRRDCSHTGFVLIEGYVE